MKKVRLELDGLMVESFETAGPSTWRGTVAGHEVSDGFTCNSCGDTDTFLDDSCGATCGGVCGPTTYAMHNCPDTLDICASFYPCLSLHLACESDYYACDSRDNFCGTVVI